MLAAIAFLLFVLFAAWLAVQELTGVANGSRSFSQDTLVFGLGAPTLVVLVGLIALYMARGARARTEKESYFRALRPDAVVFSGYAVPMFISTVNWIRRIVGLPAYRSNRLPLTVVVTANDLAVWSPASPPEQLILIPRAHVVGVRAAVWAQQLPRATRWLPSRTAKTEAVAFSLTWPQESLTLLIPVMNRGIGQATKAEVGVVTSEIKQKLGFKPWQGHSTSRAQ